MTLHNFASSYQRENENDSSSHDSWVLFQFGELDLFQDDEMITKLRQRHESVDFATGYFHAKSMMNLLCDCDIKPRILMSSPEAHGFHSAKNFRCTPAYAERSRLFFERIQRVRCSNISLHEYTRDGWTYHAKGVWFVSRNLRSPSLKSNFE